MKRMIATAVSASLLIAALSPEVYAAAARVSVTAPVTGSFGASAAGASVSALSLNLSNSGASLPATLSTLHAPEISRFAASVPGLTAVGVSRNVSVAPALPAATNNQAAVSPAAANAAAAAGPFAVVQRERIQAPGRAEAGEASVSASKTSAETARVETRRLSRELSADIQFSSRLGAVSGENAHSAGARMDAVLRGQAGRAAEVLAAADFGGQTGSGGFGLTPAGRKARVNGEAAGVPVPGRASSGRSLLSDAVAFTGVVAAAFAGVPMLGGAGMMMGREWLLPPAKVYARALKAAEEVAKSEGLTVENLYFSEASASMPVRDGAQWKFTFYLKAAAAAARADQVFVELNSFAGNTSNLESRVHVYRNIDVPARAASLTSAQFAALAQIEAEPALIEAQRAHPSLGSGVSVGLRAGSDGALRYHFFDDYGAEVAVDAGKGAVEVVRAAEQAPASSSTRWIAITLIAFLLYLLATQGAAIFGVLGLAGMLFGVKPEMLPNPAEMFPRALKEAKEAGKTSEARLVRATASYGSEQKWIFTFSTPEGKLIDVTFTGGLVVVDGQYQTRRAVYSSGPKEASVAVDARTLAAVIRVSPESALDAARAQWPAFGLRASVSLSPGGGTAGWLYRLYDEAGNIVHVDPVDGRATIVERAK